MKSSFLKLKRVHKQSIAVVADIVCLPMMFYFALILHFDNVGFALFSEYGWLAVSAAATTIPIFIKLGLYRAVIRYIDQKIIVTVIKGATLSVLVLAGFALFLGMHRLSPTPFWIYWVNTIAYVLASRFAARGFFLGSRENSTCLNIAIYGAGEAGNVLAKALKPGGEYQPVFFIDDNIQLQNTTIGGIKVYAPSRLKELAAHYDIGAVLLAIPSLPRRRQREIVEQLESLKLRIKVTPTIADLVKGLARVEEVRQIEIEDLLSRDPVEPDSRLMSIRITGKSVMVSGAGGSIGSELCRQIVALKPKRLVLFDISECALYTVEQELRALLVSQGSTIELIPCIGSVLDHAKCCLILSTFTVDTVYHAAAYKHVPMVEHNPVAGIRNNVFGTLQFAKAAIATKVQHFVLVSTDKAVRPTNVMGATKRLAELVLQGLARQGSQTCLSMVRFGNVLGSSGSVVPHFRQQIQAGGPVTVTHPEITRYFMTIPEAAQLVLQAGAMSKGGDVFVLDMGDPVRIADLAVRMIHLSGKEVKTAENPNGTIEIKYVGLRPGEKLYEELLIGTNVTGTDHPLIMRAREAEIEWPFLDLMLKQLDEACDRYDHKAIRAYLVKLVSEYRPSPAFLDLVWLEGKRVEVDAQPQFVLAETNA